MDLISEEQDGVRAIAVCHMDTANWDAHHVAFQVLGVQSGSSEVCHFLPKTDVVYVPVLNHETG
ncbi:unnamed protein product [Linum tenue]|nr:unnamed protein product [Linum tenue]